MASPQLEGGYIRIANDIWDEIIRRNFSKRQTAILQLILRLSYGCGKKSATIPKLKYFEICGVGKQNVTKELNYLVDANVIDWDKDSNTFTFNKNYTYWQISPVKGFDRDIFDELLHLNLKEKFSKQEPKSSQNKNLVRLKKYRSSQNKNLMVLKTRTEIQKKFSKQELKLGLIPCGSRAGGVRKYIIKDSIKDINKDKEEDLRQVDKENPFTFYEQNGFGMLNPYVAEKIDEWIDDDSFTESEPIIIHAMKIAVENNVPTWNYVNSILVDWARRKLKTLNDVIAYQNDWKNRRLRERGDPFEERRSNPRYGAYQRASGEDERTSQGYYASLGIGKRL